MELTSDDLITNDETLDSSVMSSDAETESLDTFWLTVAGLLPLLGLLPMMFIEAHRIWERAHYRFGILTTLVAVALIGLHFRPAKPTVARLNAAILLSILGSVLGLLSVWFFLPDLAHFAFCVCLLGWLFGQLGETRATRIIALVALLGVSIPLPFGLDRTLISAFQGVAASWTSAALDTFGVLHRLEGFVINSRNFIMPLARVAGGMDSFLILLGIACIFLGLRRHGYVATTILILSVPVWSIVYATIVQTGLGLYGNSLEVPTASLPFAIARAVAFCVVIIAFILFELALVSLTRPAKWSKLEDSDWLIEEEDLVDKPCVDASSSDPKARFGLVPAGGLLFVVGLIAAVIIAINYDAAIGRSLGNLAIYQDMGQASTLPQTVGEWRQTQFDSGIANSGVSGVIMLHQWQYSRGLESVTFSLAIGDRVGMSLSGREGWTVNKEALPTNSENVPLNLIEMKGAKGEQAYLMLASVDEVGNVTPEQIDSTVAPSPWRSIFTKLADAKKAQQESQTALDIEAFYATIAEQKILDRAVLELVKELLSVVSNEVRKRTAGNAASATPETASDAATN